MRLHRLTMTSFGPFAGTETVDFDELCSAGLFLFTGATGAGKTSILDGMCFALYGQVPGARAQHTGRSSLRSDHAPLDAEPKVVLEVTLRGRRLRVTRTPAWERPKRRGTGTTPAQSTVIVEEADGEGWRTLSTRIDEAAHLLDALLGLSLAQFCQVVLLPQGQFAEFLRADADRRRVLLESLFDTRRFADVETWLVAGRQAAVRALDELDVGLHQVVARVAEVSGAAVPDTLPAGEAAGWVDDLLASARESSRAAEVTGEAATTAALEAAEALAAAERVHACQQRASVLRERLVALVAREAARDAAEMELEQARRVAPIIPVLAEAGRLQAELEDVRALSAAAHATVVASLPATGTDGQVLPAARLVRRRARDTVDEVAALSQLVEQEQEADRLTRSADALQRTEVELAARAAKAAEWLDRADERRAALDAERDHCRAARAGLAAALAVRDQCTSRLAAAGRRDDLTGRVRAGRDDLRCLVDGHQGAREILHRLRAARLAGMAAELASGLRPGAGCPVCGSCAHPLPALAGGSPVTSADEEAASERATEAEGLRQHAEERVARLEVELAGASAAAGGPVLVDDLRAELQALSHTADDMGRSAAGAAAAEERVVAFERELATWQHERVAQDAEARSAAARRADQRAAVARLAAQLSAARGEDRSVAERRDRLLLVLTDLEGLARHLADLERLEKDVSDARDRVETAVRERALTSTDEVAAAVRSDDRIIQLETVRRQYDTDLASVAEQLSDPDLVAASAVAAPAMDALRDAAARTAAARDSGRAARLSAAHRVQALERLGEEITARLVRRAPLAARHRLVDTLSRLAEGKSSDNVLRMSLSAYVLAARLEQVALSASDRLLRMTAGRYSLVHSAHAVGGRARGGLTLRVLDSWTGIGRDPGTLSGGESFSASLALALGLADVVTAEAGGAQLETLFVDEGFGSLDDDTLDDVMGVLDDLRDGGRTVGIVSHVADLRQRIPTQLRVDKGRNGSHVHQ